MRVAINNKLRVEWRDARNRHKSIFQINLSETPRRDGMMAQCGRERI